MNHLIRELAPLSDAAWEQIDGEATRSLTNYLAARRLVDFDGPHGWEHAAVTTGRTEPVAAGVLGTVEASRRRVLPLVELRSPFALLRAELEAVDRGAGDADLQPVIDAGRAAALAEDYLVFHGDPAVGITGIIAASPHQAVPIGDDYADYPGQVAKAVTVLRSCRHRRPLRHRAGNPRATPG